MPIQEKLYARRCRDGPVAEARLYMMMIGCVVMPLSLFIFAFTSYEGIHWIAPAVSGVLFGFSMLIIYICANSYIVDSYSNFAASAVAAKTFMRSCIGATGELMVVHIVVDYCLRKSATLDYATVPQPGLPVRWPVPRACRLLPHPDPVPLLLQGRCHP
jgi:hypothetical protein